MKKATHCVHAGTVRDRDTGGVNSPIYPSSAFNYLESDEITYPRYFNTPNQRAVTDKLCALEGAEDGVLFSSGMAAISTSILAFAGAGDHVVLMDELYGGTHAFVTDVFQRLGIEYTFAGTDAAAVRDAVRGNTRVVVIESPTNPLLSVIDIRQVAELASEHDLVTMIDNTFATPMNQNPLQLGMDIVVHSGTKYLGGHSDICCGVALAAKDKAGRIRELARSLGGSLNAITCYLLERSLKTLAVRVQRQGDNAGRIAEFLAAHPGVARVYYPGLPESRGHDIARSQMRGFGAMLSFELKEGGVAADDFIRRLRLIEPAVSLGGVESTICSPARTSHAKLSAQEREKIGITPGLLRLSVGIEELDDLLDDLATSLA